MMKHVARGSWVEVDGKRFYARSQAEKKFGLFLNYLKQHAIIKYFAHEPRTFWFEGIRRGCVSYKPDFLVEENDGSHWWAEVKGYMDAKSATKLKRFAKYFPDEEIRVIDSTWVAKNSTKLKGLVKGWADNDPSK